jgi:hypothetical protein
MTTLLYLAGGIIMPALTALMVSGETKVIPRARLGWASGVFLICVAGGFSL